MSENHIFNATVSERIDVNKDLAVYRIKADRGHVPEFTPGQFITLGLLKEDQTPAAAPQQLSPGPDARARPKMYRRAYSIASAATTRDHIEFLIVLVDEGHLTPKIWKLHQGDRLWMDDKAKGEFTLDHAPDGKDLVMVGTGTGLAPFVSMLRTYKGQSRWRRFVLIHGVRLADDLAYRDELEQTCRDDPSVIYIPTVTREPDGSAWSGLRGRVQAVMDPDTYQQLVGAPLDAEHCHVFLCGNPKMITSIEQKLQERGFVTQTRRQPGNIHFERYW